MSTPFDAPRVKPPIEPTRTAQLPVVIGLLLFAFFLERMAYYGFRAHQVPALMDTGADRSTAIQYYGWASAAISYGVWLGAAVAAVIGPRWPALVGAFVSAIGVTLAGFEAIYWATAVAALGQILLKPSLLAWIAWSCRRLNYARRLGVMLLAYAVLNLGAAMAMPLGQLASNVSGRAPFFASGFVLLLFFLTGIAAMVVGGRQPLDGEPRRGAPELGLLVVFVAASVGTMAVALGSEAVTSQIIAREASWMFSVNPAVIVLAGTVGGIVCLLVPLERYRALPLVAGIGVAVVGLGLVALTREAPTAIFLAGTMPTTIAEAIVAVSFLSFVSYVHPRLMAAAVAVWSMGNAAVYQLLGTLTPWWAVAAGVVAVLGVGSAIAVMMLGRQFDEKFFIDEPS